MHSTSNSEITFLVEDIETVLEMNRFLERENKELKHEVARLKAQISALKAHDIERKSALWKKIQSPVNGIKDDIQHKEKRRVPEGYTAAEKLSEKPSLQPMQIVNQKAAVEHARRIEDNDLLSKGPPPPPPPLPSKSLASNRLSVRRMPEVIQFYRYLNKRNVHVVKRTNVTGTPGEGNPRNMIGEIENRSTYLSAVKSDVEMQQEFISFLIQKVETAVFTDISAVETFVRWLDGELSCLVDERAVLKHFPNWPERKTDALREAAGLYRDLKNIESKIQMHKDDHKQPLPQSLGRIQALQDRLEGIISSIEMMREGACKRYKELHIPWMWMLETGLVGQIKLCSLKLAREYMKRVIEDLRSVKCNSVDDRIHQAARFACRAHQFTGGFDLDTKHIFEDLKRVHTTS